MQAVQVSSASAACLSPTLKKSHWVHQHGIPTKTIRCTDQIQTGHFLASICPAWTGAISPSAHPCCSISHATQAKAVFAGAGETPGSPCLCSPETCHTAKDGIVFTADRDAARAARLSPRIESRIGRPKSKRPAASFNDPGPESCFQI